MTLPAEMRLLAAARLMGYHGVQEFVAATSEKEWTNLSVAKRRFVWWIVKGRNWKASKISLVEIASACGRIHSTVSESIRHVDPWPALHHPLCALALNAFRLQLCGTPQFRDRLTPEEGSIVMAAPAQIPPNFLIDWHLQASSPRSNFYLRNLRDGHTLRSERVD